MKEFHLTLAKLRSGDFKLTLWPATEQCRLRYHEHLQRLRHLHSLSEIGTDSAFRDQVSQEVLGVGGIHRAKEASETFSTEPKRLSDLTGDERVRIRKAQLQKEVR